MNNCYINVIFFFKMKDVGLFGKTKHMAYIYFY